MPDSKILITASLEIPKSVSMISDDLKQISAQLNSKKALQITCNLNLSGTQQKLQNELSRINSKAKISPSFDTSVTDKVVSEFNRIFNITGKIDGQLKSVFNQNTKNLLTDLKSAFNSNDVEKYFETLKKLQNIIEKNTKNAIPDNIRSEIQNLRSMMSDGSKVFIDENTRDWLQIQINDAKHLKSILDNIYGTGKWTFEKGKSGVSADTLVSDKLLNKYGSLDSVILEVDKSIRQLQNSSETLFDRGLNNNTIEVLIQDLLNLKAASNQALSEFIAVEDIYSGKVKINPVRSFENNSKVLDEAKKYFENIFGKNTVTAKWIYNAEHDIEGFTAAVRKSNGELENFKFILKDTEFVYAGGNASNSGIKRQAEQSVSAMSKLKSQLDSVKSAYMDLNSAKPVRNQDSLNSLDEQYRKALTSIEALKTADTNTFASMKANADSEIQRLKDMVKQFQNAEYVATSLRTKDFKTVKSEEIEKLKQFEAKIKGSNVEFSKMKPELDSLSAKLSSAFTKENLTAYLNELSIVQAKFHTLEQETVTLSSVNSSVSGRLKSLNSLLNINSFNKNSSSTQVTDMRAKIQSLIQSYTELQTKFSQTNVGSPEFANLKSKLSETELQFVKVLNSARLLDSELKKSNGASVLSEKISKLKNDITAYMNANSRAVNKMSSQNITYGNWANQLTSQLKSGIDTNTFNQINAQFRTMRSEINALGYSSNTSFGSLWSNIRKVSGFLGIASPVFLFVRKIREAVTELKTLDTILTEISKASGKTRESLDELGETSFDVASRYGQKASDYLTGVRDMSRAGFSGQDNKNMAELSTLAQSAGDMTAELSNQYLIATNQAYKLNGSIEKLNSVLDSQNYVTNHNALNMTELANATKIADSQSAQSGIAIDKATAAMGTMIASTQQGGEIAGRAFKAIVMNLQQVKAEADEIGDGGEAITEESLTKYEKACETLGVSLKEVKDGVSVLRDPMEILNELAVSFNKEADNSIKKANLINAVGGKYRGNQLSALLSNWDMYEKMLAEFNSGDAVGSAMKEAVKTAESWEGRLNSLSNSWAEFINNFIKSDTAKTSISSVEKIVNLFDTIVNKAGALKTILISVAAIKGLKNSGIFTTIDSTSTKSGKSLAVFNKEWKTLVADVRNASGIKGKFNAITESVNKLSLAQKAATVSTRVLGTALNIALNVGLAIAINAIISQVYKLVNAEKEAKQKAEELRQTAIDNAESLSDESQQLDSLISRYTEIISKTGNLSDAKEDLKDIQNELADSHNLEADSLDLLNGKYAENIELINKQKKAKAQEYTDNADNSKAYRDAKRLLESESVLTESVDFEGNTSYIADNNATRIRAKGVGNWGEATRQNWKDLGFDNINFLNNNFNDVYVTGTLEEKMKALEAMYKAYEEQIGDTANEVYLERLHLLQSEYNAVKKLYDDSSKIVSEYEGNLNKIDELSVFDNDSEKLSQFNELTEQVINLNTAFQETNSTAEKLTIGKKFSDIENQLKSLVSGNSEYTSVVDGLFKNIDSNLTEFQNSITSAADTYISSFNKYKEGDFETTAKQIKTFTDALDTLSDGEFLDSDTMWELVSINEELSGSFQKTANGYIIGSNKIISAKDELIKKQTEYAESELKQNDSIISDLELQIQNYQEQRNEFAKSIDSSADIKYLKQYDSDIQALESKIESVTNTSAKWKLVLKQLNGSLGNTVSKAKQLEKEAEKLQKQIDKINDEINGLNDEIDKLQGYADELLEYQENKIDNIINNLEDEQKILEDEKSALEEQLDTLENQKSQIEEQIKLYEDVVSTVTDAINDEKSLIEKEKDLIESEKKELQNQLDILEEKKQKTEETIQDYEKIYSIVSDTIDKQIESIEKERDATESYYDDMISKLQEQNSERERSIELAEKETALENAKKNKIRVYNEQKGWTWEDNTEEIQKAQNDLDSFKNQIKIDELEKQKEQSLKEYDEKISAIRKYAEQFTDGQNSYTNEQDLQTSEKLLGMSREEIYEKISSQDSEFIKQLNDAYYKIQESRDDEIQSEMDFINKQINQKNEQSKVYDDMISEWDNYIAEWENTVKGYKKNQDKLIAEQKLGSDWLERVKQKDTSILDEFKSNYESYQTALNGAISQEITDLQNSITAKEKEIESKKNQISEWTDYKDQLSDYVTAVSTKWSDYVKNLDTVVLDENSTFEQRKENLDTFKTNYGNLVDEIMTKQGEMSDLTSQLEEHQSRLNEIQEQQNSINFQQDSSVYDRINELHTHYQQEKDRWDYYNSLGINSAVDAANINEIASRMGGLREQLRELYSSLGIQYDAYATGGVNTKTGFAWLDGTPDKPELVLNNNQATRLYNFLNGSGNIGKTLLDSIDVPRIRDQMGSALKNIYNKAQQINTVSKSPVYNININGNIVTNSAEDFMRQMDAYIAKETLESMNR